MKEEVKRLKEELEDKRKANAVAATKLNKSFDLIRKMEGIVQQPTDILNKTRLFDEGLAKNPVTTAKVVPILVDFNQRMEEILMDMRRLFEGLEVEGLVPLDQVSNISINTEELPTLQGWRTSTVRQTPTPTKPATTPGPTPKVGQKEGGSTGEPEPDLEPIPTPKGSGSPSPTALDDMAATTRWILSENPDIAERMMEHLPGRPLVPL